MQGFNHKWRVFILTICASILICALSYNKILPVSNLTENVKSFGFVQIQKISFNFSFNIKNFFANLFGANRLARENEALAAENCALKNKIAELEFYGIENKQLKELLKINNKNKFNKYSAQVIGRPANSWFDIVYIDKGEKSGIKKGDIAVNNEGLVGKVTDVFGSHSQVLLAVDPQFVIGCKLPKTGDTGLLYGYNGREYIMKYVESSSKVAPGDIVVTSNLSKTPENITVGAVKQVNGSEDYMYKELIIEPVVKFSRLRYLYIFGK